LDFKNGASLSGLHKEELPRKGTSLWIACSGEDPYLGTGVAQERNQPLDCSEKNTVFRLQNKEPLSLEYRHLWTVQERNHALVGLLMRGYSYSVLE
jgi:hypothetical protein